MTTLRRLLVLPCLALLAASSAAQFDMLDWTNTTGPGPGSATFVFSDDTLTISGPTYPDPCLQTNNAISTAVIPFDATLSFRVTFSPDDGSPGLDWPIYVVNGDQTHLTEACQGCEVVVEVDAGDSFGLGNHSQDCLFTAAVSVFEDFKVVPRPGSSATLGLAAFEAYGHAVARIGDLDFDGIDDLAVGAPRANVSGPFSGRVTVLSGADGSTLFTLGGAAAGEFFGFSIAAAGDVDDDGVPDLLVGAPFAASNGQARLISGAGGGPLGTVTGDQAADQFGSAVAGVGDANGDTVPDFVVGAPKGDLSTTDAGYARVYSGATLAPLATVSGTLVNDGLGAAVAGVGDLDGDTVPEFLVGVPGHNQPPFPDAGRATAYSALTGNLLWSVTGTSNGARLGSSVASVGDLDGDLVPDVALGAPVADDDEPGVGRVSVHSGIDGALLFAAAGHHTGDRFGAAVGGAGDVDDDGVLDVAVGAPGQTWEDVLGNGTARVLSGRDGGLIGVVEGGQPGAELGFSVAGAGDTDGDGHAEILVGAPKLDFAGTDSGKALVVSLEVIWADFGHGLAGTLGVPTLHGTGLLVPGEQVKLRLQNVPAAKPAALVIGFAPLLAPFKGGVMVPNPALILSPHITTASGITIVANWPSGLPSGFDVFFQYWIPDTAGPAGFSASNGIRGTIP